MSENFAPFYAGQEVVAADAVEGSYFKNGQKYIVAGMEFKPSGNPISDGRCYWYIGIVGFNGGACWYKPSIFTPIIPPMVEVTFEKVVEENPVSVN